MSAEPVIAEVERRHGAGCACRRCVGAERNNDLAETHGAYAVLKLAPRAEEITAGLREIAPLRSPADGPALDALGLILAQLERAHIVLATHQMRELESMHAGDELKQTQRDDLRRLAADARGWANTALRYFEALGLSAASRARLGLDVARAQREMTVVELHALADRERAS
jgi:hypothetical protein